MHCFVHDTLTAVGICKNCGRGLCTRCAADLPNGLACSGRCEPAVARIDLRASLSARIYLGLAFAFLVMGGALLYESFSVRAARAGLVPFLICGGVPALAVSLLCFRTGLVPSGRRQEHRAKATKIDQISSDDMPSVASGADESTCSSDGRPV